MTVTRMPYLLQDILSGKKAVNGTLLNLLGVQVQRTLAAHVLHRLRRRDPATDSMTRAQVEELRREGIVVWHDFLPTGTFAELQREHETLLTARNTARLTYHHGPNRLATVPVDGIDTGRIPATHRFLSEPRLLSLLEAAESRDLEAFPAYRVLEQLVQGPDDGSTDPETRLHSDVFFPCHKAWLYLSDVELAHGPFAYVKRSHRISLTKLCHVYWESCTRNEGSRRIDAVELARLGLRETVVTCAKNTLVVANVSGYHRRLCGRPGNERRAVHINLRGNPFEVSHGRTPFPPSNPIRDMNA
jgi:hypothetical protein